MNFKIALRVAAYRTDIRRFRSHDDVTAVSAFPDLNFTFGENGRGFNVFQQSTVTFFVMFSISPTMRNFAASSGKPSSSAVLANPSYISVHS